MDISHTGLTSFLFFFFFTEFCVSNLQLNLHLVKYQRKTHFNPLRLFKGYLNFLAAFLNDIKSLHRFIIFMFEKTSSLLDVHLLIKTASLRYTTDPAALIEKLSNKHYPSIFLKYLEC